MIALLSVGVFLPTFAQHEGFVDMGVMTNDGKNLLWSDGDLFLTENNRFELLSWKKIGDDFGWGDITGKAKDYEIRQYGGTNPPTQISGNPKYDICTAKLGADYRLPTYEEIKQLLNNCTLNVSIKDYHYAEYNSLGFPTWIYGEWMWQGSGSWYSLKFDDTFVTVMSSTYGYMQAVYQGPYAYKDGRIAIPNLFKLTVKNGALEADNGKHFEQISRQTRAGGILYAELTSKINGNKLHFTIAAGPNVLKMNDERHIKGVGYWSGELNPDGSDEVMYMLLRENGEMKIDRTSRMSHSRIRAVKEYIDPVAQQLYREKCEKEMRDSLQKIEETREKLRQDSIRRMESIKSSPLLNAFLEMTNTLSDERFFDAKYASHSGDTTSYYICATANTQKTYKEFWKKVASMCDKGSCWERKQIWSEMPNNKDNDYRVNKKNKETNNTARRSDFSLRCFSKSYYYIGKIDRHSYGDYMEILNRDDSGKLWYTAWAILSDEKGYTVPGFKPDNELVAYVLSMFDNQVKENIYSLVCKGGGVNNNIKISPVLEIPKSKYGLKVIPVNMSDYACTIRLGKQDICIPFLTVDKCKPGTPLYKVDIITRR